MIVLPVNPQTGEVWKAINTSCNTEEKGAKFFQYFNEGAYSANDVILSSNISSKAKPLYFSGCYENDKAGKNGLLYRFIHDNGPLLIYLYKRPTATETHGNHIFCLKKSTNLLYGMNLMWNGPWLT